MKDGVIECMPVDGCVVVHVRLYLVEYVRLCTRHVGHPIYALLHPIQYSVWNRSAVSHLRRGFEVHREPDLSGVSM